MTEENLKQAFDELTKRILMVEHYLVTIRQTFHTGTTCGSKCWMTCKALQLLRDEAIPQLEKTN